MANLSVAATPLVNLLRELRDEGKNLIKQEVQLAKAEVTEKLSVYGKNSGFLVAGGFIAYAGVIVLLVGIGALIGYAIESAGLHPMLAAFIGLAATGILIALVGYIFIAKALKTFKHESLAPTKTVNTLQHLAGQEPVNERLVEKPEEETENKESSDQLAYRVTQTQTMVGERMEELSRRIRPEYMSSVVKGQVRTHPARSLLVAFGTGLASAFMVARRFRRAHAPASA
jgi:hypothetical protein